ncbi:YrhB domain-containing protein [Nocardia inohanensis]|uniref:YrhB domain-containing protein n=1 Tax=Nocardia inohanensis TaxID=209246 RepID=UPI0008355115|nr:YrhB domain-containing protein [Nocardia inohanensis]
MDRNQARQRAEAFFQEFTGGRETPYMVYPEPTDHGWCYLFTWNTKRYFETRDIADSMGPGSGPIAVVKATGDAWMLTSAPSFDMQLDRYAREHGIDTAV